MNNKTTKNDTITRSILFIIIGILLGVAYKEIKYKYNWIEIENTATDNIKLCFTPPSGCSNLIVQELAKAKKTIYMQAYVLTLDIIINQLIDAYQRGLDVNILLDYSHYRNNSRAYKMLKSTGVKVNFDKMNGIAHNKVIIIDETKVITGSFNFSYAADTKNAENVIMINNPNIANQYLDNWFNRKVASLKGLERYKNKKDLEKKIRDNENKNFFLQLYNNFLETYQMLIDYVENVRIW
ncbi:phospholipase D-like domain-containing protein [Rickettsia endosymbiont of Cardiosporidium cionae]|uniref:phospholipase D-like domain-containing protein n=1 Tax=Rickettsia endosymbiont of Cardiosporidium cionae TaxID=2777155 RepID=UPI001892E085|nr:phospholipase D-like domain-containing protein [Rickettsia endosymbiont of Cardiosporidium cionae]KAF8818943.1 Cardiolipin synthase A [Rickettsia endosymbiont of Cardiosporidium cionae]